MPPNPANTQTQQTLPSYTTPPPQPRSAIHYRHPITNNLIRGPPPTHTDPSTSNGHSNHSSVFDTSNLESQTSPASKITTEPQTESQGHVALNVPTPSFLEEITPQCFRIQCSTQVSTAHGNISHTELPQTQHFLATTVEGPLPSPRTETPRSQRYSQRVSNQTKRNHNYISTFPIPLPQTTAITCLSDPAPTNQLATLSKPRQTSKACTADTRYPPWYQKEDTQPNRKSATYAPDSNHRHCCIKLTISNSAY